MSQNNVWDLLVYTGFGIKSHDGVTPSYVEVQGISLWMHGWPMAAGRTVGHVELGLILACLLSLAAPLSAGSNSPHLASAFQCLGWDSKGSWHDILYLLGLCRRFPSQDGRPSPAVPVCSTVFSRSPNKHSSDVCAISLLCFSLPGTHGWC